MSFHLFNSSTSSVYLFAYLRSSLRTLRFIFFLFLITTLNEFAGELLHQIGKSLIVPRKYRLSVPQTHQKAINYTHNWGRILEKEYEDGFVKMTVEMGSEEIRNLEEYVV